MAAEESEVVEVIASHYLDAYQAAPDADDAAEIKRKAYETLVRAGVRAASLGAAAEARRTSKGGAPADPLEQADLLARAGEMAGHTGDPRRPADLRAGDRDLRQARGHPCRRAGLGQLAHTLGFTAHRDKVLERLEHAFEVIVTRRARRGRRRARRAPVPRLLVHGDLERAAERAEFALEIAEEQDLRRPWRSRSGPRAPSPEPRASEEAFALLKHALEVALKHDLLRGRATCYFILSDRCFRLDRYADALHYLDESLAIAHRLGNRPYEWAMSPSAPTRC